MNILIKLGLVSGVIYGTYLTGYKQGESHNKKLIEERKYSIIQNDLQTKLKTPKGIFEISEDNQMGSVAYRLEGLLNEDYKTLEKEIKNLRYKYEKNNPTNKIKN